MPRGPQPRPIGGVAFVRISAQLIGFRASRGRRVRMQESSLLPPGQLEVEDFPRLGLLNFGA
jgi:hypothetical protein